MADIFPRFKNFISSLYAVNKDTVVFSAFSGGKDSTAQLILLKKLQNHIPFTLKAAYFNHCIRNDAAREQQWVKSFCLRHHIPLVQSRFQVLKFSREHGLNLEHAASNLRYRFFSDLLDKNPESVLATAHTRSDQTETFFIKLIRGSGAHGLSSIFPKKHNRIIRPLLIFSEKEILTFLKSAKIAFYTDHSNADPSFLRNNIRINLLPSLRTLNPELDKNIASTVTILQSEYQWFSANARRFLSRHLIADNILPVAPLLDSPLAVLRHILREYIYLLKGNLQNIGFSHIEGLICSLQSDRGLSIPGISFSVKKGFIFPADISPRTYRYELFPGKTLHVTEAGVRIRAELSDRPVPRPHAFHVAIPAQSLTFPLIVRNCVPADRYKKVNSSFTLKVTEMIRESGIPARLRFLRPLVCNGNGAPVWSTGSVPAHIPGSDAPGSCLLLFAEPQF